MSIVSVLLVCISIAPRFIRAQTPAQLRAEAPLKSVDQLILDLYSDSIPWNADIALQELRWHRSPEETIPLLQEALTSLDYQQRQLAANLLHLTKGYTPDELTAEVMVEGLRDDTLPNDPSVPACNFVFNASWGVQYLIKHPQIGTEPLEDALYSDDDQQQFLAACILAVTKRHNEISRIAEILIPHLEDDLVIQNAGYATRALYELGEGVLPYLHPYTFSSDEQQGRMARFIIQEIEAAMRAESGDIERTEEQCVSTVVTNPARQLKFDSFYGLGESSYSLYDRYE